MDYHKNVPCRIMHFPFFILGVFFDSYIYDLNYYFWNCSYQIFDPSWKKSVKVSVLDLFYKCIQETFSPKCVVK